MGQVIASLFMRNILCVSVNPDCKIWITALQNSCCEICRVEACVLYYWCGYLCGLTLLVKSYKRNSHQVAGLFNNTFILHYNNNALVIVSIVTRMKVLLAVTISMVLVLHWSCTHNSTGYLSNFTLCENRHFHHASTVDYPLRKKCSWTFYTK